MMIYGLFLEGSTEGIKFLFKPDTSKILDKQVWQEAAV
jgi:SNF family Na+-dependent transporter